MRFEARISVLGFLAVVSGYVDLNLIHNYSAASGSLTKLNQTLSCPPRCNCNINNRMVFCNDSRIWHFDSFYRDVPTNVRNLTVFRASFPTVPANYVGNLTHVRFLTLNKCTISTLEPGAFNDARNLELLDLGRNYIKILPADLLRGLRRLKDLDLRDNLIETLPEGLFDGLSDLKSLKLQDNFLKRVSPRSFYDLRSLVDLNLSNNRIVYFESEVFATNAMLKSVALSSNRLRSLSRRAFANSPNLETVHLDNNPWQCSCYLRWLADEIATRKSVFENSDRIRCNSPRELKSIGVEYARNTLCTPPLIVSLTDHSDVLYRDSIMLDCNATGFPTPSVYWVGPQGTVLAHESQREWITSERGGAVVYSSVAISGQSSFQTFENGSLLVMYLHSPYSGNYSCVAENPIGKTNLTITVSIVTAIPRIYAFSMYVSGICASVVLVVGVAIASVKYCVTRSRLRKFRRRKPGDHFYETGPVDEPMLVAESPDEKLKKKYASGKTSLQSSPSHSRSHSGDELEDFDDEYYSVSHIKDTIDEMGLRLRTGVERRVEKMRSQMSNLHESSNQYMQNLRDSGQKAVQKVRVGVVMSVEQVKQQMLSMKELCGRGDMCQTVSTVSVTTDIDSREKSTVVKSITYV
ncbi:uncharacterized protein LOC141908503 [Tubulanus polymorphus]|uniref:uncharacterized protein LOC141908503 n=1 Tax=Tubulanus polymorphus TaxID=672921 RepID=UPI003DA36F9E